MNRDGAALVTKENQARMKVITAWNPHFTVDSHEMGALDTYLMEPPRQPLNPLYSDKDLPWRQKFGFEQGAAFDKQGWSYYAKDWNTDFAAVYTGSWTGGAIAMLYEQAGVNSSAYKLVMDRFAIGQDVAGLQLIGSTVDTRLLIEHRDSATCPGAGINRRKIRIPILGIIAPPMLIEGGTLLKAK